MRPGSSAGLGPGEALLGPAAILAAVQLGPLGRAMVAGRAAVRARARPVRIPDEPDAGASLHGLGAGADEYELLVDAERGVLLRAEARLEKEPFRVLEAVHVEFDPELPEEAFSPPPSRPAVPDSRPLTLELHQAAGAVPFAVFVPERPPPGSYSADVTIDSPDPDDRTRLILYISWNTPPGDGRGGRSHDNLTLMEAAEPLPDIRGIEWSDIAGLRVGPDRHGWQSITRIRLLIGGTHVDLSSDDIPRERLLGYARSLVRLPDGPPALRQGPPE